MLLLLFFAGFLAFCQCACAALFSPSSPVVTADAKTFDEEVLSLSKPTFVAFTAPWCGHCRNLSPEYERASRSLDGIIKFVNVDCDDQRNAGVCQKYGVTGFPTIKIFPPTKKRLPKDYRGERTAKAMIEYATSELPLSNVKKLTASQIATFVQSVSYPPVRRRTFWPQPADYDNATRQKQGKVLLFTAKPSSTPLYKSLALDLKGVLAFATARSDHKDVSQAAKDSLGLDVEASSGPKLVYVPSNDASGAKVYDGQLKYKSLLAWLQDVSPEAAKATKPKPKSQSKSKPKKSKGHTKKAHKDL